MIHLEALSAGKNPPDEINVLIDYFEHCKQQCGGITYEVIRRRHLLEEGLYNKNHL